MTRKVSPIPKGFRTATPCLTVNGIEQAINFYAGAFDADVLTKTQDPSDTFIVHSTIKIGNSIIALQQENLEIGFLSPLSLGNNGSQTHLYVEDVDMLWSSAMQAGATAICEPMESYWGDRTATLLDPFGHRWSLASRVEHVSSDDITQRSAALYNIPAQEVYDEEIAA